MYISLAFALTTLLNSCTGGTTAETKLTDNVNTHNTIANLPTIRVPPAEHYTFVVDPSGSRNTMRGSFTKATLSTFAEQLVLGGLPTIIDVINVTANNPIDALQRFVLPGRPEMPKGLSKDKARIRTEIENYQHYLPFLVKFLHKHIHSADRLTEDSYLCRMIDFALEGHAMYNVDSKTKSTIILSTDFIDQPKGHRPATLNPGNLLTFPTNDSDRRRLLISTETDLNEFPLLAPLKPYRLYSETDLIN